MRWECKIDGLTDNWFEVSDRWTRNEERALIEAQTDEEFWVVWRQKATACHLVTAGGNVISDPAAVEAAQGDLDVAVLQGIGFGLRMAPAERRKLGNASWRGSFDGAALNAQAVPAAKVRRSPKPS